MAPSRGLFNSSASKNFICNEFRLRIFTTSTITKSGHNRWSKIKHDKLKTDAAKNKQRSVFAHEISNASKFYGPDPATNPKLADIITKAKREGFAKASIEAAIARGQGKGAGGEKLETVTIEGILPGNVGVVIECETDSKARTMMELRHVLKEAGGMATPSAYLFERKGRVVFEGGGMEEVMEAALEAGAEDVDESEDGNGDVVVLCDPSGTNAISEAVCEALKLQVKASEIVWIPVKDTLVEVDSGVADELDGFVDALQDKEPSVIVAMNVA